MLVQRYEPSNINNDVPWFQGNLDTQPAASVSDTSDVLSQSGRETADLRPLHQLPLLLQGWVLTNHTDNKDSNIKEYLKGPYTQHEP